jgi:hypothetical protein
MMCAPRTYEVTIVRNRSAPARTHADTHQVTI